MNHIEVIDEEPKSTDLVHDYVFRNLYFCETTRITYLLNFDKTDKISKFLIENAIKIRNLLGNFGGL